MNSAASWSVSAISNHGPGKGAAVAVKKRKVRGKEEGAVRIIPLTIIPLTFLLPIFNAKSQRRQDAKREEALCASASLPLCVANPAILRGEIFAKLRDVAGVRRRATAEVASS
jgi:hypothetical protein